MAQHHASFRDLLLYQRYNSGISVLQRKSLQFIKHEECAGPNEGGLPDADMITNNPSLVLFMKESNLDPPKPSV